MGAFLNRLERVKKSGDGYVARCPAHKDNDPSLSVTEEGSRILLHCFTGCEPEQIVAAMSLTLADLFTDKTPVAPEPLPFVPRKTRQPSGKLVSTYYYTDGGGAILAEKGRFELEETGIDGKPKKSFLWRLAGEERWSGGVDMTTLALWGAEEVTASPKMQTVYFCEGERATEACRAAGLLAVTHGGGASTKDFGKALEVLRGRQVALWPDNDGPGREYMATVHARIRDLAASVRVVTVPLPPKGDAVEFFAAGGTLAELETGALLVGGTSVEFLSADAIRVRMSVMAGIVNFTFADIERVRRNFDCSLTVAIEAPGVSAYPFEEDIDLNSNTQISNFRRSLDTVYGKDWEWTRLLNSAISLAKAHYANYDRSVDAFDIEPLRETELFFANPLISRNAVTIIFGDRSSLKSYLVFALCMCATYGEPFLEMRLPQVPVLVIDYEDNAGNFRRRLDRIGEGLRLPVLPGLVQYYRVLGTPFTDIAANIRRKVVKEGIGLVIVDSLGPATGGDPLNATNAIRTMEALRSLDVTVIVLAHVPKNHGGEQPKDPFGSVFYSNEARRTWYIEREQDEASDFIDIGLYCKKVNDGPLPRPIALSVEFVGLSGPVKMRQGRMSDIPSLQERRPPKDRLWDALERGRAETVKALAEELGLNVKEAQNALSNNPRLFSRAGFAPREGRGQPAQLWGRAALHANTSN